MKQKRSKLKLAKSTLHIMKILYTGCLSLSIDISAEFSLKMCAEALNCKKFTKTLGYLWGLWSFKVIGVSISWKCLL